MTFEARTDRRRLVRSAALSGAALAVAGLGASTAASTAQGAQATPAVDPLQTINPPEWVCHVYAYQDPYRGNATRDPLPGTRWVAAEIGIDNNSEQALSVATSDLRVRLGSGLEVRAGEIAGTEPRLNPRNLNAGEVARGWVWFSVEEGVEVLQLVFVSDPPEFRFDPADASS